MMMDWNKLLTTERLGEMGGNADQGRSRFEKDFDRILFSSAFRRLQDKTQIFPLASSDFVRTRLTHSIEVASMGRGIGNIVGRELWKRNGQREGFQPADFGNVV